MSPGNQKIARALFESQRSQLPPGSRPLTLDEIAARKRGGEGWGRVFDGMKSQGLVDSKNLGQAVSSYNHRQHIQRQHISSARTVTTASNRTIHHGNAVNPGRGLGPKAASGDHGRSAMSAGKGPGQEARVHADRGASSRGAGHGGGRSK